MAPAPAVSLPHPAVSPETRPPTHMLSHCRQKKDFELSRRSKLCRAISEESEESEEPSAFVVLPRQLLVAFSRGTQGFPNTGFL